MTVNCRARHVIIYTPDRRQSKTLILSTNGRSKIARNRVFDCHLSLDWRQMAIENTFLAIYDPRASIVKSVFDSRIFRCDLL